MGVISKKLASRFHKAKKQVGDLRRQAAADFAKVPKDVKSVEALVRSGHDPLHAAYIAAQNFTSFFAEAVSQFREFDPYCEIVGTAEVEYDELIRIADHVIHANLGESGREDTSPDVRDNEEAIPY
jgi:hypothetical protein